MRNLIKLDSSVHKQITVLALENIYLREEWVWCVLCFSDILRGGMEFLDAPHGTVQQTHLELMPGRNAMPCY